MSKATDAVNKCFVMFLKRNGALHNYSIEYDKRHYIRCKSVYTQHKERYLLRTDTSDRWAYLTGMDFIMGAFTWLDTPQGMEYWSRLNSKWEKIMTLLRDNNYEISEDISRAVLTRCN